MTKKIMITHKKLNLTNQNKDEDIIKENLKTKESMLKWYAITGFLTKNIDIKRFLLSLQGKNYLKNVCNPHTHNVQQGCLLTYHIHKDLLVKVLLVVKILELEEI